MGVVVIGDGGIVGGGGCSAVVSGGDSDVGLVVDRSVVKCDF